VETGIFNSARHGGGGGGGGGGTEAETFCEKVIKALGMWRKRSVRFYSAFYFDDLVINSSQSVC